MHRARVMGVGIVIVAFVVGGMFGAVVARRTTPAGVRLTLTTTTEIPRELERLDLSDEQRVAVQAILRAGHERVVAVIDEFDPRMRAAVESVDEDIRGVLTPEQRASFDAARRAHPILRQRRILRDSNGGERTMP
ncbi:MAG: hypothetical protein ABIY52_13830 [Gemmatimonadaceae bacterium]